MKTGRKILKTSLMTILLALAGLGSGWAQKDSLDVFITVKGQLLGLKSHEPVSFAHVVNKTRMWGAISDTAGNFSIPMHRYDTLVVSAIGYDREEYLLPAYAGSSPFHTKIFLNERSYPIKEVEVHVLGTWKQFSEKLEGMRLPETKEEKLGREITTEAREIATDAYQIPTGITFSLPSRYNASLQKLKELEAIEARQIILYRKYNREVIARTTGLEGKELDQFIIFCNQRAWFTPDTPAYDIIYQIKVWYRQYTLLQRRSRNP